MQFKTLYKSGDGSIVLQTSNAYNANSREGLRISTNGSYTLTPNNALGMSVANIQSVIQQHFRPPTPPETAE